jgi:CheY-like chemotaxis protein
MATIMIADDAAALRRMLAQTLSSRHAVIEAVDGGEALEFLRRQRPDVAILDVVMPVLSGLQVCRRLRADPDLRHIGVIVLSANAGEDDAHRAGANCFIAKPFLPSALLAAVDSLVRNRDDA